MMNNYFKAVIRNITKGEFMLSQDHHKVKTSAGCWALVMAFVFCGMMLLPVTRAQAADVKLTDLKKATYVGTDVCATCHEKEYKEYKASTHARIDVDDEGVEGVVNGCEMCHGPGSIHVDNGGGKGNFIINAAKNPETCLKCHTDKRMQFNLPYHHPVLEGKMSCSDCHKPHSEEVRPWTSTSLDGVNEACFKCHQDKRGPFMWGHEALAEGCATCHQVHGSVNDKMLIQRDNTLCLKCHAQVNFPTIGKSGHGSRLQQGTCFSGGCHTAVHGSNFDAHLRY